MTKKVTTNKEIVNELNKLRAEIASIKATKQDELYSDTEESAEEVYTFTLEQLSEFVKEVQDRTMRSLQTELGTMDLDGCVEVNVENNTISISVDSDMVAEKIAEEQEDNDFCSLDEDDIMEIYQEIC